MIHPSLNGFHKSEDQLSALASGVAVHISSENKIYYTLGEGSSGQKFNLELNEEIQ